MHAGVQVNDPAHASDVATLKRQVLAAMRADEKDRLSTMQAAERVAHGDSAIAAMLHWNARVGFCQHNADEADDGSKWARSADSGGDGPPEVRVASEDASSS
jgi:hypothetical protein